MVQQLARSFYTDRLSVTFNLFYILKQSRMTIPHVETYWESWDQTHGNYGSNLSNLPVVPVGMLLI